jgi:predicted HicB family RNase H-like nuclease
MAERLHRTQILLEPEQHRALAEIARREGRSLSDVVREMLRQQIEHQKNVAEAVI